MPTPCPCCRASNDGPTCRRCKADLSPLVAVADRRAFLVSEAQHHTAADRPADALAALGEADTLGPGDDTRRLRAAALLLAGDFAAAWAAYHEEVYD